MKGTPETFLFNYSKSIIKEGSKIFTLLTLFTFSWTQTIIEGKICFKPVHMLFWRLVIECSFYYGRTVPVLYIYNYLKINNWVIEIERQPLTLFRFSIVNRIYVYRSLNRPQGVEFFFLLFIHLVLFRYQDVSFRFWSTKTFVTFKHKVTNVCLIKYFFRHTVQFIGRIFQGLPFSNVVNISSRQKLVSNRLNKRDYCTFW